LVVGNAATAQPSLGHDGVQTSVGFHRVTATAAWWLSTHKGVDCRIAPVLFFDLSVPPLAHPEEDSTKQGSNDDDTDDDARNNPCYICALAASVWGTCRGGSNINNAGCAPG
jgi:hypothetical protein